MTIERPIGLAGVGCRRAISYQRTSDSPSMSVHKHLNGPINHAAPLPPSLHFVLCSFVLVTSHYSHPLLVGCDSEQLVRGGSQKNGGARRRKTAVVDSPNRGGLVIIYSKGVSPISQCFRCSSPTMDQR